MDSTATYTALGRLIAVVEAAGGMPPAVLGNCLTAPKTYLLGQQLTRAIPKLRRMPELDAIASEIIEQLTLDALADLPAATPLVDQGTMQIAYYQQRTKLPAATVASSGHAGVDWSTVDWSQRNADLARELGVSPGAVRAARIRHQG